MIYRATGFIGHNVLTKDGAICSIEDIYFDDQSWHLRYFALESEGWSSGQRVLISLNAISNFDDNLGDFTINITEEQIKASPGFNSEHKVSRYHEEQLNQYYGWKPYWSESHSMNQRAGAEILPPEPRGAPEETTIQSLSHSQGSSIHLRSLNEVKGCDLYATDGAIGTLQDFLIDRIDLNQAHIIYFIVDSHRWLPGGVVLIDRAMVENVSWKDKKIFVSMTRDEVKNAPVYDRNMMFTEECITQVSSYYQELAPHKTLQGLSPQGRELGQQPLA